ncbi:MAG: aquaporin [Mycobacterium sp.]
MSPVSGAHLNPVVTLADRFFGGVSTREATAYIAAQLLGAAASGRCAGRGSGTWSKARRVTK